MAFLASRHFGKYLRSPYGRSDIPPIPWQSDQPLGQVLMCCLSGPSGPYTLPLSALSQQHVGTSHAGLLTSEEFPTPTWGTHQGRAQCLSCILLPSPRFLSPSLLPGDSGFSGPPPIL